MKEQLINKFNEFNEDSYYQKIDSSLDEIFDSYQKVRNNPDLDISEREKAVSEEYNRISKIIYSSGMSSSSNLPFEFEREFFINGDLDEGRYRDFKRRVLQHQSSEEQKWIFAGTTGSYTRITQKALSAQNKSLNDLLPAELRQKNSNPGGDARKPSTPGAYQVFVYPDGTMSPAFESSKAQFSFERTKDKSGVPWDSKYNADMVVDKKNWDSGFNKNGEWEQFNVSSPASKPASPDAGQISPLVSFDPQFNDNMEFLYVISLDDKKGMLCDEEGLLVNEQDEQFYSFTGELYASRKTDTDGTALKLKNELEQKGLEYFSTVIIPDASETTKAAYKNALGTMINEHTQFRTAADPQTHMDMAKLRESITGNHASSELIRRYRVLQSMGYEGDELYNGLEHEKVSPVIERELSLFTNKKDLETFVSMPAIDEIIDKETAKYLQKLDIPEEKSSAMSSAVQNLLYNYKDLFQYTGLAPKDVVTRAYETIVQGNSEKSSKIIIPGETTLSGYIKQQTPENKNTTIPTFHSGNKTRNKYNLFIDEGFGQWQKETPTVANDEMALRISETLNSANLDKSSQPAVSAMLIAAFKEFKAIQENTGITPEELVREVLAVSSGKSASALGSKRILLNKSMDRLIDEASAGTKHTVRIQKSSIMPRVKVQRYDLFKDEDFREFVSTPEFGMYGLSGSEVEELSSGLKEISLPDDIKPEFVRSLINVLPQYKNNISTQGYSIKRLINANSSYVQKNNSPDAKSFAGFLGSAGNSSSAISASNNFVFVNNQQFNMNSEALANELKGASLSEGQIQTLLEQYKQEYISYPGQNLSPVGLNYRNRPVNLTDESYNRSGAEFSNLGWKTVNRPGMETQIIPLRPAVNKMSGMLPGIRQNASQKQESAISFTPMQDGNTAGINEQMVYTSPAIRPSARTASAENMFTDSAPQMHPDESSMPIHAQQANYPSDNGMDSQHEDSKMKRIINNYDNDRRQLAKPDESGNSAGNGAAAGKGKGGGDIKKTIEALYNEFKEDVEKTI